MVDAIVPSGLVAKANFPHSTLRAAIYGLEYYAILKPRLLF